MKLYRLIYYSLSALHVSGDVFAHHQEHLTVFTASGNIHQCRCWLMSRMSWNSISNSSMTPAGSDYRLIYYSLSALHVSADVFSHHQEHLTVFTASGNIHHGWVPAHPWHQPAATCVNITRCCKYSQVLLMMGEKFARSMYNWLYIIN